MNSQNLVLLFSLLYLLISCASSNLKTATNFSVEESAVIMSDGSKIIGKVPFPINHGKNKLVIERNGSKQKIKKSDISKVEFNTSSGKIEYINLPVYNAKRTKIKNGKKLLATAIKGPVNLYYLQGVQEHRHGTNVNFVNFTEYYCKRDSEDAATLIHVDLGIKTIGKNQIFKKVGKEYFSDDVEIVNKIENKEFTYRNLMEVVVMYNSRH